MSALQETIVKTPIDKPMTAKATESIFARFLNLLCSVRFGIVLLILLGLACLAGMLIMQQNVDGFDRYYLELTPSQRLVYGTLGFFDIYHAWYFNALLAVLSLNIVLSSIDRFPKTWLQISKTNVTVPVRWLKEQQQNETFTLRADSKEAATNKIVEACRKTGWRKTAVAEKGGRTFVFAQAGAWNRLGAYAVHVALLTIILGGFLTGQYGYTGNMALTPGQSSNEIGETVFELNQVKQTSQTLPFTVFCTDIQQKLIKKDQSISAMNTIDWLTKIQINDENGTHEATVQMNRPFDYRGYRFFQSSFVPVGRARTITMRLTPANGGQMQDITLQRDGATTLPDGTKIVFANFRGNFSLAPEDPNEDTSSYPNPAAVLQVTAPGDTTKTAYAFGPELANIPSAKKPVAGYTYQLIDFEKVGEQHILSVQHDPGATVVYVGFSLLFLTLVAVFFFSHQRVWAVIEPVSENDFNVVIGGNTNHNQNGFADKFKRFVNNLRGQIKEVQQ